MLSARAPPGRIPSPAGKLLTRSQIGVYTLITGQGPLADAIPLREAIRAHIENGPGGDRMDSLPKDIAQIISPSS